MEQMSNFNCDVAESVRFDYDVNTSKCRTVSSSPDVCLVGNVHYILSVCRDQSSII